MKKSIILSVINIEDSKTLKYHTFSIKQELFVLFVTSPLVMTIKYLKKKSLEILKALGLINNINE